MSLQISYIYLWLLFAYFFLFQSESALMIDAVHVVVNGVITMEENLLLQTLKCEEPHNRWHQGARLTQEILDVGLIKGNMKRMAFWKNYSIVMSKFEGKKYLNVGYVSIAVAVFMLFSYSCYFMLFSFNLCFNYGMLL